MKPSLSNEDEDLLHLPNLNPDSSLTAATTSTARRDLLQTCATTMFIASSPLWMATPAAFASDVESAFYGFERNIEKNKLYYTIQIPNTMNQGQKPVKTHLDEVNFKSDSIKGYQLGITVDPVRINSLKEVREECLKGAA